MLTAVRRRRGGCEVAIGAVRVAAYPLVTVEFDRASGVSAGDPVSLFFGGPEIPGVASAICTQSTALWQFSS